MNLLTILRRSYVLLVHPVAVVGFAYLAYIMVCAAQVSLSRGWTGEASFLYFMTVDIIAVIGLTIFFSIRWWQPVQNNC